PRALLRSKAWRSLSINGYRVISFLLVERMNHAGKMNGHYLATLDQLVEYGISNRKRAVDAIREVDELGLVDAKRAGQRSATKFMLTWYPGANGETASHRWKTIEDGADSQIIPFEAAKAKAKKN